MPIHGFPGNVISATPPSVTPAGASGVFTTEQQMQYQAAGNWPMAATQISRSLRFNSADSAYLNRTPASASNRKTWTWSGWVKRGLVDTNYRSFFANGNAVDNVMFWNDTSLAVRNFNGTSYDVRTTQLFRDPSAWYHLVIAMDTTQATASNRIKIYVNGVQVTAFAVATYPSQNYDTGFNTTTVQYLGYNEYNYFDGYMTEVNFIDGLALTPASFGQTNSATGVWEPRQYTGPYGTNGFYLNFSDNSGTTSTTLGKDYSGNGNNWTPNNFSVTAGAGNDSLVDSPTAYGTDTGAGGEVRGNYCTLNPLNNPANSTLTNGNLDVTTASSTGGRVVGTVGVSSGKWYWEITPTSVAGQSLIGIAAASRVSSGGVGDFSDDYAYQNNGNKYSNSVGASYGASYVANDVIGVALDLDAGTLVFYKNNSSQGTAYSSISGTFVPAMSDGQNANSSAFVCNFGQRPFAYTAPSGFKALCTQNLPTPDIGATATSRADDYFNTVLYTGDGNATAQAITGVGFQPDFVWLKARSQTYEHIWSDRVRGAGKILYSSLTNAEATVSNFVSFDSDGFTVNAAGGASSFNQNGTTYASWNWKANGAGSTNNAGSIQSTVSASTLSGFSIVTYTGTGVNATVGHGLGVAPQMVIVKNRTSIINWPVWHIGLTSGAYAILLDTQGAQYSQATVWNSTIPTSSVISVGTVTETNKSGDNYVAYCFAPVANYSSFGKYVGNGSSDGPFIYTGFRPACIIFRVYDGVANWLIHDNKRNTYNVVDKKLFPNLGDAEATADVADFLSNGFKLRGTNTQFNGNGYNYIYAAFAENPFKYSLAR